MAKTKTYKQHVAETQRFESEVHRAVADGMTAIGANGSVLFDASSSIYQSGFGNYSDPTDPIAQQLAAEAARQRVFDREGHEITEECQCSDGRRGGLLMGTSATMLDWSQQTFGPVADQGTDGLGFAIWGPGNLWPGMVYRTAASHPFTASVLDYLERTLFGYGAQVVYCITRYSGGTVTHEEVPFRDAGVYLQERCMQLMEKLANLTAPSPQPSSPEGAEGVDRGQEHNAMRQCSAANKGMVQPITMPNVTTPSAPSGEEGRGEGAVDSYTDKLIVRLEQQLDEANAELESYWETRSRLETFLENNNLNYFYKRWIADMVRVGVCWPMVGLARGAAGNWGEPEIVELDIHDSSVMRFEERNPANRLRIDYVYYSERWRDDANGRLTAPDYVAYPALMPEHALADLRHHVQKNNRTKVGERPYWFCCPNYQPTPTKPYYPQLPWWSIFPSQVYQYASTLIYDKATARKNSTMWGKILFINTAYLAQIFAQAGEKGKTPEGQAEIRRGIYNSVENFLKRRDNNGKLLVMDSYPSADEKQMIDSIRIVDVPRNDDVKASATEISEIASLVSYTFGVNMDLIGSRPGTQSSTTGTAQRELHLLKNGQLAPDRVTFTDFFNNFVFRNNRYDPHFKMVVNYPTLTTLDNSKTGTIDMHDGK